MNTYDALKQAALRVLPDRLLLLLKKMHYGRVLERGTAVEPEFEVLAHLVRPGDVVMDLGANIGTYTKLLSTLVGTKGAVYSIEPIPLTYEILCSNIERFKLSNVKAVRAAASDQEHMVEMEVPRYSSGGGENFYQATIVEDPGYRSQRRFTVRTITVDAVCNRSVQFIKCDVEGHEDAVIRGAVRTIQTYRPAWLIEVSKTEVVRSMQNLGYSTFYFDGTKLRRQTDRDRPVNSFFLTDAHLEILERNGLLPIEVSDSRTYDAC